MFSLFFRMIDNLKKRNDQPGIEIHAVGEADGNLTWYEALGDKDRQSIIQSQACW